MPGKLEIKTVFRDGFLFFVVFLYDCKKYLKYVDLSNWVTD